MAKKIYIFADLEGISGVFNRANIVAAEGRPDLIAAARRFMAADINACVEGCFQAGANEVIVRDGHCCGDNLTRDQIDPRADLISGLTPGVRFADLEGSDGLILLGYHAMAGALNGILDHTYSSASIQNIFLNGRKVGEVGIDAAIAAAKGVPVIMVSGDDVVCAEAAEWIPGVVTCEVKKGFGTFGGRLPALEKTHELITRKTVEAIGKIGRISCMKPDFPVRYKVEYMERIQPEDPWARTDARTVEYETNDLEKALLHP